MYNTLKIYHRIIHSFLIYLDTHFYTGSQNKVHDSEYVSSGITARKNIFLPNFRIKVIIDIRMNSIHFFVYCILLFFILMGERKIETSEFILTNSMKYI